MQEQRYIRCVVVTISRDSKAALYTRVHNILPQHPALRKSKMSAQQLNKVVVAQVDNVVIEEAHTTAGKFRSKQEPALGADVRFSVKSKDYCCMIYVILFVRKSLTLTESAYHHNSFGRGLYTF